MKVDILGTPYEIIMKRYDEDKAFEKRSIDGYCDAYTKRIIVCDIRTNENWKEQEEETKAQCQKEIIKHEIVHAFFTESGLDSCSNHFDGSWAINEEMVDWIALQGEKIYKAWGDVGLLEKLQTK